MNGPGHYAEAERGQALATEALTHATLALAAATAGATLPDYEVPADDAWREVIS